MCAPEGRGVRSRCCEISGRSRLTFDEIQSTKKLPAPTLKLILESMETGFLADPSVSRGKKFKSKSLLMGRCSRYNQENNCSFVIYLIREEGN